MSLVEQAVRVSVPATSANLGPGFDSVGLALGVWDECTATVTDRPGLVIEVEGSGAGEVPLDERHLVYRSMLTAWSHLPASEAVEVPRGLHLRCHNAVPHGRGLGSSATASVTGIVAAQGLSDAAHGDGRDLDRTFANDVASMVEGHPDNASASVYGGLTLSWSDDTSARVPVRLCRKPSLGRRSWLSRAASPLCRPPSPGRKTGLPAKI